MTLHNVNDTGGARRRTGATLARARGKGVRPHTMTTYNDAQAQAVIEAIEQGAYLAEAARDAGVPTSTLYQWRAANPEFAQAIADARAKGAEAKLQQAERGLDKCDTQEVKRFSVKLRYAQWYAERVAPQEYADVHARGSAAAALSLSDLLDRMAQSHGETIDAQPVEDAQEISEDD